MGVWAVAGECVCVCSLFVQGSDDDVMKKRAERFGEISSTKLGKVGTVNVCLQ